VIETIHSFQPAIEQGLELAELQFLMSAGAARNAVDCAMWDLLAKKSQCSAASLAGVNSPAPQMTAYTLSLDTPEKMHLAALENAHYPMLKLKLAGAGDIERVKAVRDGAPAARLIVDANEGWTAETYQQLVPELYSQGVEMIEQPLPAGEDDALKTLDRPIPLCADESCHDSSSLTGIIGKYDMINIKLDKTGGLTEALALKQDAQAEGLGIMVGCMLATSLAMAPAIIVAQGAQVVDLDGPLLLEKDRDQGMLFENGFIFPATPALWG
jgi:L-alanine-DL-glutamate epimerase-like enolase superfamily enzyme